MNEFLLNILQAIIITVIPIVTVFCLRLVQQKIKECSAKINNEELKDLLDHITESISTAVVATNQTYVDELKGKNMFTKEAQEEALHKSLTTAVSMLSNSEITYLKNKYGDEVEYLTTAIEAEVNKVKNIK